MLRAAGNWNTSINDVLNMQKVSLGEKYDEYLKEVTAEAHDLIGTVIQFKMLRCDAMGGGNPTVLWIKSNSREEAKELRKDIWGFSEEFCKQANGWPNLPTTTKLTYLCAEQNAGEFSIYYCENGWAEPKRLSKAVLEA